MSRLQVYNAERAISFLADSELQPLLPHHHDAAANCAYLAPRPLNSRLLDFLASLPAQRMYY